MSRYVAVLLCLLTSIASASAAEGVIRRYMIVNGDSMSGSWDESASPSNEELRARYGDRFAWFREDGLDYIVTDSAVMNELDRAMEPQKGVNRMQAGVNREQKRVNEMQSGVNAHQHDVNALQRQVNEHEPGTDQESVNRKQSQVNAEQAGVNAEQAKVNAMQEKVNVEQHRVSAEFSRRMQEILGSALTKGAATRLR